MPEKPLKIWCMLDRVGGLQSSSVYYKPVREVREVITGFTHKEASMTYEKLFQDPSDIENFLTAYGREKLHNPSRIKLYTGGTEEVREAKVAYLVEIDKKSTPLKVSDKKLIDEFLKLEKKEKKYLSHTVWDIDKDKTLWLFYAKPRLSCLTVREGQVIILETKKYTGGVEKAKNELKDYLGSISPNV